MSTLPTPTVAKTCANCRFAATDKRPKIMDATGFGDQLMFDDTDETVYTCKAFVTHMRVIMVGDDGKDEVVGDPVPVSDGSGGPKALCEHAGKVIGTTPITCEAWMKPQRRAGDVEGGDTRLAELDRLIAAREARTKDKE